MARSWQWDLVASALGLLLIIVGAFGAWVPHETSALTVTGIELIEYSKFFPQVQSGAIPIIRELFSFPVLTGAVTIAVLAHWNTQKIHWRVLLTGLALVMALTAVPPYQFLRDPEYRRQLILSLSGILLILLTPLVRAVPNRIRGAIVALLTLIGAALPTWQFYQLRPLVVELYDAPVAPGWGMVAFSAGSVLLFGSSLLFAIRRERVLHF
ncbi:MAG: hypothetical protein MUQ10_09300 [Anaerolineae bacterium]|nr:hypothetical protein [Anaerolineae bacterium]